MADMSDKTAVSDQVSGGLEEAKKELDMWKAKVEKADDTKSRLLIEKLEADEAKVEAKREMNDWMEKLNGCHSDFKESLRAVQDEVEKFAKHRQDLLDKLKRYQDKLEAKRAESAKLKQKFKIYAQIPDTEVRFSAPHRDEADDDSPPISGVFTISQRSTVPLKGGQALITFEEEKVASQILKIAKCTVSCDTKSLAVKPKRIRLDPVVKFEVHLNVSRKDIKVSNVPPSMPVERMKDRLEMSFSRPSRGGGEVERVEYDNSTGTGRVTFLHPGVAESLALRGKYTVDLDSEVTASVGPVYKHQLRKFQTFCGSPKRTILLDDIKDMSDEEDLQDYLEIHFQKPSNCGGEIESIKYLSEGKNALAVFYEEMEKDDE